MSAGLELPNPWWGGEFVVGGVHRLAHKTGLTDTHTHSQTPKSISLSFHWSLSFTLLDFYNRAYIVWIAQWHCACYVLIDAMVASGSETLINRSLLAAIINEYTPLHSHWLPLVWMWIYIQAASMWAYYKAINILAVSAVRLCVRVQYVCMYACVFMR